MSKKNLRWQTLDASELVDRLSEVKGLLEQAAALAAAQEGNRILTMTEVQRHKTEAVHGEPRRRRYR